MELTLGPHRGKGLDILGLSRIAELSVSSRLTGNRSKFSLVFHVEGLVNPRTAKLLKDFGTELQRSSRPCCTVVTPLCPMYNVDPLQDPLRSNFKQPPLPENAEKAFESNLQDLSERFDLGYHGHFFSKRGNLWVPASAPARISEQFNHEFSYLVKKGHRPKYYSGGWWLMTEHLVGLLSASGFEADTTVNDTGLDSFGSRQQIGHRGLGRPFMLARGLVEIPSFRSWRGLLRLALAKRSSFAVISLHDYDLANSANFGNLRRLVTRLAYKRAIVPLPELVELATKAVGDLP